MKKADNFDASKWLTENKITFQSRLNEMATMIKKNSPFGSEKPLQVGDTIMWKTYSNDDRGMGSSVSGRLIGKVVKILGTANLQAEDIKTGDLYKVSRTELTRVPNVGDKIEATASYNFGSGSGSQGSNKISGIVKKVNLEKFSIIIQTENSDKPTILDLKDLSDVKIYGLNESRLNEDTRSSSEEGILALIQKYVSFHYTADQGYGVVAGDDIDPITKKGKPVDMVDYAESKLKELETKIINIKGAEYFAFVEELASLLTYDAEYAGPEDDLLPKQEELASKLGFTLDQIRDI